MGYYRLWVITGMGYDRFDCTRIMTLRELVPRSIAIASLGKELG
jgi:hypothetical protein